MIRGQSGWVYVAGYMKAKTIHKRKSEEFSWLEELPVLFGGPEVSPVAWKPFKEPGINVKQFLVVPLFPA